MCRPVGVWHLEGKFMINPNIQVFKNVKKKLTKNLMFGIFNYYHKLCQSRFVTGTNKACVLHVHKKEIFVFLFFFHFITSDRTGCKS